MAAKKAAAKATTGDKPTAKAPAKMEGKAAPAPLAGKGKGAPAEKARSGTRATKAT